MNQNIWINWQNGRRIRCINRALAHVVTQLSAPPDDWKKYPLCQNVGHAFHTLFHDLAEKLAVAEAEAIVEASCQWHNGGCLAEEVSTRAAAVYRENLENSLHDMLVSCGAGLSWSLSVAFDLFIRKKSHILREIVVCDYYFSVDEVLDYVEQSLRNQLMDSLEKILLSHRLPEDLIEPCREPFWESPASTVITFRLLDYPAIYSLLSDTFRCEDRLHTMTKLACVSLGYALGKYEQGLSEVCDD